VAGLAPHAGEIRGSVPCWLARPGEVEAIANLGPALTSVWLTVLSVNGNGMTPCYAAEDTLADTLGIGRRTVQRRILELRAVPGLLLEIPRGMDRSTGRMRPYARWATDPLGVWRLTPGILGTLPELAEMDGDTRWTPRG
jgi:hypothetical protein